MSAKLTRMLLCGAIAGLLYVPSADAGVFQLVEITSGPLEERLGSNNNGDNKDDGDGDRTIQGAEATGELDVFDMVLRLLGFMS